MVTHWSLSVVTQWSLSGQWSLVTQWSLSVVTHWSVTVSLSGHCGHSVVTQWSLSGHSAVTQRSLSGHCGHSVVTQWSLWSLSSHSLVTQWSLRSLWSLSGHSVVTQRSLWSLWSLTGHSVVTVVTQWSLSGHSAVTQRSLSGHSAVTVVTHWSLSGHCGHQWSLSGHSAVTQRSLSGHSAVTQRSLWSLRSLSGHSAVTVVTQRSLWSLSGHCGHSVVTQRSLRSLSGHSVVTQRSLWSLSGHCGHSAAARGCAAGGDPGAAGGRGPVGLRGDRAQAGLAQAEAELQQLRAALGGREDALRVKARALELLPDAQNNLGKLQLLVESSSRRLVSLAGQWERHRGPLLAEYRELRALRDRAQRESSRRLAETRALLQRGRVAAEEARRKETLHGQLVAELAALPRDVSRAGYTQRILELVGNIRKQKEEIGKILEDTRALQKEINALVGKLERTFSVTDELLFKVGRGHPKNGMGTPKM
uniref:Coiled-coil domain-containing protein 22 n=1 Tax=Geospiza parvula TaxID=87175 RepID=A0A8U8BDX3_GEOPR